MPTVSTEYRQLTTDNMTGLSSLCQLIVSSRRCTDHSITVEGDGDYKSLSDIDDQNLLSHFQHCLLIDVSGVTSSSEELLLLERWSLRLLPKRHSTTTITYQSLIQAIQSFLHFSQISSWTVTSGGRLPFKLSYRLSDCSRKLFHVNEHQTHQFPVALMSQCSVIQITVEHLPRLNEIPPILNVIAVVSNGVECKPVLCKQTPPTIELRTSRQIKLPNKGISGVRPPGASSPVPSLLTSLSEERRLKRRSYGFPNKTVKPTAPVRSMSLPAVVPNLCLLGTFEESVLNGRIEPCGFVEGFTAELGASGSFCPEHILLPVTASFFHLSDDGGPSPYLGQLDLVTVSKRGYRIPLKGTVQLTLFNPNKTVVNIFIVKYDHTDMPACTSTFIRQKTISTLTSGSPPCLHYLIHLRFLCSRSGRLYLHTDIKLIFAHRVTDVSLVTVTEGPSDPKYGPLSELV